MITETQIKEEEELWYFDIEGVKSPWFEPGQMFVLSLDSATLDAVILNTHIHKNRPPSHDVGFWVVGSGMLILTDIMPALYTSKDMFVSEDFVNKTRNFNSATFGLTPSDLFYVSEVSSTERHIIFPHRDTVDTACSK